MSWNKVFSNPKQHVREMPLPTLRGRAVAAVDGVDRHLSEAQKALQLIQDDPEARHIYNDLWDRIEKLRWHVRKVGEFKKPRQP